MIFIYKDRLMEEQGVQNRPTSIYSPVYNKADTAVQWERWSGQVRTTS